MRKSVLLMLVALFGFSSVPADAQDFFARARLRAGLHQCNASDYRCATACLGATGAQYKECRKRCDAAHKACVDLAFSSQQKKAEGPATLLPRFRAAGCRHWPCNCHYECIRWDQDGNCTGTYRTCDICSICD